MLSPRALLPARIGLALALVAVCRAPGAAGEPAPVEAGAGPELELSRSQMATLHGWYRAGSPPGMLPAARERYRRADELLAVGAGPAAARGWALVDGLAYRAAGPDGLRRLAGAAGGERFPWLEPVLSEVAAGLEAAAGGPPAPPERPDPEERLAWWASEVAPRWPALLAAAAGPLALPLTPETLSVTVVPVMPDPGGATFRGRGGPFSVVDCRHQGSAFAEVVLHEALHALDARAGDTGLLAAVRKELAAAGAGAPLDRDLPHAVLFVAAATAVARTLDPGHVPVGVQGGAYERGLAPYLRPAAAALARTADGADPGEVARQLAGELAPPQAGRAP